MIKEHKKEQRVVQETVLYTEYFCDICKNMLYTRWNNVDRMERKRVCDYMNCYVKDIKRQMF